MSFSAACALVALAVVQAVTAVGERPAELEFKAVLGGDGRTKLAEFSGQPLLIAEFSSAPKGLGAAKLAVELEQESREAGLVALLMESAGHDAIYLRALQMRDLPGTSCWLLGKQDLPVAFDDTSGSGPRLVLFGVDGTLLFAGSHEASVALKKLLHAELDKRKKGWGTDATVRKARALAWGNRALAEARTLVEEALKDPKLAPAAREELAPLTGEFTARFDQLERAGKFLVEQGEIARSRGVCRDMLAAAGADPAWTKRAIDIVSDQLVAEMLPEGNKDGMLEEALELLLRPAQKAKPRKDLAEKLRAFAREQAAGTRVGARAERLAEAVSRSYTEL